MARIRLATIPTTDTPPTGQVSIYAKGNKKLYLKDDTGAEYELLVSGTPGASGYNVNYVEITAAQAAAKEILLPGIPTNPDKTLLDVMGGGGAQVYLTDFTVTDDVLSWSGGRLDGILDEGDEVRIVWF